MNNTGWQMRNSVDGSIVASGIFGGDISMETANRIAKVFLDVVVKPSGHAVFIYKKTGETVKLFLTVDPSKTDKGIQALKEYRKKQQEEEQKEKERRERIEDILDSYSTDELEVMLGITKD